MTQQSELFTIDAADAVDNSIKLQDYDIILVNSSGGKDSLVTMDTIVTQARQAGCLERVHVVHCDLERMEWEGTDELVKRQVAAAGISDSRLHIISRPQGDILQHVADRFEKRPDAPSWPSSSTRYCTSDHKRGQVQKVITRLSRGVTASRGKSYQVKVLNCMGMRAAESTFRSKLVPFKLNERSSTKTRSRLVYDYLPIHHWSVDQVWAHIRRHNLEYHYAYDLGMPRLSCAICIFSPRAAIALAATHNRPLLDAMCELESKTGYDFRQDLSLRELRTAIDNGTEPIPEAGEIKSWEM